MGCDRLLSFLRDEMIMLLVDQSTIARTTQVAQIINQPTHYSEEAFLKPLGTRSGYQPTQSTGSLR